MRRREFITLIGGAGAAWPLAARAERKSVPVVGYLHSASPEPYARMIAAFRDGLKEGGYVEGQNVVIEFRWAEDRVDRLPSLAAELVERHVTVIATAGGPAPTFAAKRATTTIPIVFVTARPIESGLVSSLNRPESNLTGIDFFTTTLGPKRLDLLRKLMPSPGRIAVLNSVRTSDPAADLMQEAAQTVGQQIDVLNAENEQEIDTAFASFGQRRPAGLFIASNPVFTSRRQQIVTLANHYRIPTIYPLREYVVAGGLMSYGTDIANAYRQSGAYVSRILAGAKPGELPILQPTKFELVANLRTAKATAIEIPPNLLALVDEAIE